MGRFGLAGLVWFAQPCIPHTIYKFVLVPFLTTMEVVAPLENDPILSGRSIWSFRHLELQNPSIIGHFIAV